ncbi:MAG: CoA-transferase [Chloroflexi bacterium]|nr:CoA-transferase [Chloroflexota bacterium]
MAYAKDYTLEEQLIARMARLFKPEDEYQTGAVTFCGMAALTLAKLTRAPRLILRGTGVLSLTHPSIVTGRLKGEEAIEAQKGVEETFIIDMWGGWYMLMSPAQIDQYGNANISLIGDKSRPSVALIGSRGMPDNCTSCPEINWVVTNHIKRTFVPCVDFISGPGWVPERVSGEIKYGHPRFVFSNLGVMDFEPATHRMRLASVHTGVIVQQVQENTGFELAVPVTVPETETPTEEEVRLIREVIDPLGIRRLDHVRGPQAAQVMTEVRERGKALPRA